MQTFSEWWFPAKRVVRILRHLKQVDQAGGTGWKAVGDGYTEDGASEATSMDDILNVQSTLKT